MRVAGFFDYFPKLFAFRKSKKGIIKNALFYRNDPRRIKWVDPHRTFALSFNRIFSFFTVYNSFHFCFGGNRFPSDDHFAQFDCFSSVISIFSVTKYIQLSLDQKKYTGTCLTIKSFCRAPISLFSNEKQSFGSVSFFTKRSKIRTDTFYKKAIK